MNSKVRTRFAPSPTGHLHIGNARTAIINWIFAGHSGGSFVLRIEDTDVERSTPESEASILEDLRWLGLDWDEGPEKGGAFGPYRQSERSDLYLDHLEMLTQKDLAYPCYCLPEELEARRKAMLGKGDTTQYDKRCRDLTAAQIRKFVGEGRRPAFRFRADAEAVSFGDLVRGDIVFPGEQIGDFVIMKSDGTPMYNFACVVDDHLMGISHVIRGDDHISNTPRQILLYQALGWEPPVLAHIPMILGPDREKLSKRHGVTSVDQYRTLGYLPDALVNFLSLLSWSSESGEDILSRERLIREFDFNRISKSASIFNVEKLDWMNGMYIRQMEVRELARHLFPFLHQAGYPVRTAEEVEPMAVIFRAGMERLSDAVEKFRIFFAEFPVPESVEAAEVMQQEASRSIYKSFLSQMDGVRDLDRDAFQEIMKNIQQETGLKGKALWAPVRIALTGRVHGPDLPGVAEILGPEKCRKFAARALGA
ncbi:glutamate--tRNA ligase [bacterium]|nr:glutamate--tRNA ligase [bacterium]